MLKSTSFLKLLFGAALVSMSFAATAQAADPNGTWQWKFKTQGGQEIEFSLELEAKGEALTGELKIGDRSTEVKEGTFKGNEVKFKIEFERNGRTSTVHYVGKLDGDTIKGTTEREVNGEKMSRDWEAKRAK